MGQWNVKIKMLLGGFLVALLTSVSNARAADSLEMKIARVAQLEETEYVSYSRAKELLDLEGWSYVAENKGFQDGFTLAFISNYMADLFRIPSAKKEAKIHPLARVFLSDSVLEKIRATKLNFKVISRKAVRRGESKYELVGVQAYSGLIKRTDSDADMVLIFRNTRSGLKLFDVRASGIGFLSVAFANMGTKGEELKSKLLKGQFISDEQVRQFPRRL